MKTVVPIDSIQPDPQQPRKVFDEDHLNELAQSLKIEGLINAVEIDGNNMIITGERRWRAAKLLGWTEIEVNINPGTLSTYERLRRQMAENFHQSGSYKGSGMNPMDTAKAWARLIQLYIKVKTGQDIQVVGASFENKQRIIKEVAKEVSVNEDSIREYLALLDQPEFVQRAVEEGLPRTYIREADNAPEEYREAIKQNIVNGAIASRDEVSELVHLTRRLPESAQAQIELNNQQTDRSNQSANKILSGISKLGLALELQPLYQLLPGEQPIIERQLTWIYERIGEYLYGRKTES